MGFSLEKLNETIVLRAGEKPQNSYTASLLAEGTAKCAQKLGEEAVETVIAALGQDKKALIGESADLLYHLLVLLKAREVSLDQIMGELERRTSRSGLEEKAARSGGKSQ